MDNRYYNNRANYGAQRGGMRPMQRNENGGACECGICKELLCKLRAIDFAIYDLALYLDVYPECFAAEEKICALRAERVKLVAEYEKKCGALTFFGACAEGVSWKHSLQTPAPWEYSAN